MGLRNGRQTILDVGIARATALWPLEPFDDGPASRSWIAHPPVCNARSSLFGGWMMGALAQTSQDATGGSLREMSVGFLAGVPRLAGIHLQTHVLQDRGRFRHVRLEASVGDVTAAVAQVMTGPPLAAGTPGQLPVEGGPDDWPGRAFTTGAGTGASRLLEIRPVGPDPAPGDTSPSYHWISVDADVEPAVAVTVISDAVPVLVRQTMDRFRFVPTMTAHLRIHAAPSERWHLVEVGIETVDDLVAHGVVRVYAPDGAVVATGGQGVRLLSDVRRSPDGPR